MRHPIDLSVYLVLDPDLCHTRCCAKRRHLRAVTGAALEKKSPCGMRASIEVCLSRL